MGRELGTLIITDPDAPTVERSTITCCHCQRVVIITPGVSAADMGGFCRLCFRHTCGPCADKPCTPFEAKLERMEGRRVFLRGVEYLG